MIGKGWRGQDEKPEGHSGGRRGVVALLLAFALIAPPILAAWLDRKSTRLNSSH